MGYETSAACVLVATHCSCCGKPLVDAVSVETGMGPWCRKKVGWSKKKGFGEPVDALPEMAILYLGDLALEVPGILEAIENGDLRVACNKIVYQIALAQVSERTPNLVAALAFLGFRKLSEACARGTSIYVEKDEENAERFVVRAAFNEVFNEKIRVVPGVFFDRKRKVRVVPVTKRAELWQALKASWPKGTMVFGAKVAVL